MYFTYIHPSKCVQICLFLLYNLFKFTICQQTPTISYTSPDRMVNIGDTVDLQCSVQYAYGYPVIWAKVDPNDSSANLFISRESSLSIPDNRYSIRHDPASSTYTLQLSKIQEIDSGVYQCQILLSATSRVSENTRLTVNIPPAIADNSTRSFITSVGASVQLQCWATGQPRPTMSWRRQNNDLLPTGGTVYKGNVLYLYNVSVEDRGTYYCVAENGVGDGAKRNVLLEVEFVPRVTAGSGATRSLSHNFLPFADNQNAKYYQAVGYPAELECTIESYPLPTTVEWTLNDHRLNDDLNIAITLQEDSHAQMSTRLRIQQVQPKHFGVYACVAVNKLGLEQKQLQLLESSEPVCPPACGALYSAALMNVLTINQLILILFLIFVTQKCTYLNILR